MPAADLKTLLERGYFPKELPRPFTTASFAALLTSTQSLEGEFRAPALANITAAKPCRYSLAKQNLFRRNLSVCHPLSFFLLAREITQHWPIIEPKIMGTSISATAPEFKAAGRAIDGKIALADRSSISHNTRLGRSYILRTDISRFYSSIYTHTIPWALHSKATAKRRQRDLSLLGNRVDRLVRLGQDQQTVGIPIGPDTSLVLAELIMQRCDESLLATLRRVQGHRFIDDYEICFNNIAEAEEAFHILGACLSDYELALNERKTHILKLPLPADAPWVNELRRFSIRDERSKQAGDLSSYFDTAFILHSQFPDEAVLQFAVARLRSLTLDPGNWELFQKLLLLSVMPQIVLGK